MALLLGESYSRQLTWNVPHPLINLSLTEAAQAIVARNAPNEQENVVLYDVSQSSS